MVDGEVTPSEVQVLLKFARARRDNITMAEAGTIAEVLARLSRDAAIEEFVGALLRFQANSIAAERKQLANFAMQLVAADGRVARNENALIRTMRRAWGINNIACS